jgi:hypothetical protein
VNSPFGEQGPAISKDGRSLYFGSNRPGGSGGFDIWVSQRTNPGDPWGPPVNLGSTVNTASVENIPALSRDEHWMFFNSDRPGGLGAIDLWASWRANIHDDFGWETPVNLGAPVNSAFLDQAASYFENDEAGPPLLFLTSDRPGGLGSTDIYVSEQAADGSFKAPTLVVELSSPFNDNRSSIRFDGLEIFLFSGRPGGFGLQDLWSSTRESVFDAWSTPANLGATVNSAFNEFQPYIAPDRLTLYFASDRPGGLGLNDLYMTTRAKAPPGQQ